MYSKERHSGREIPQERHSGREIKHSKERHWGREALQEIKAPWEVGEGGGERVLNWASG